MLHLSAHFDGRDRRVPFLSLEPLVQLPNLTCLDLSYQTGITSVEPLAQLPNLTRLHLTYAHITSVEPLAQLGKLGCVRMVSGALRRFPRRLLDLASMDCLFLWGNPIEDCPPEILGGDEHSCCLEAARAHFADRDQGVVADRELKLILLGNGGVGKTCVMKRLVHDRFDPDESSTHGIRLEVWWSELNDGPVRINVWDFGGQDTATASCIAA